MTALQLYKFIGKNENEYHWHNDDVILFVNVFDIREFNALFSGSHIMDDEGIKCAMKDRYFCFMMKDICEYFGIELKEIFKSE